MSEKTFGAQEELSRSEENGVLDAKQKPLTVEKPVGSFISDDVTTSGVLLEDCVIEEDGNPPNPKPDRAEGATSDPARYELLDCECALLLCQTNTNWEWCAVIRTCCANLWAYQAVVSQVVVTYVLPVEAFATRIKMESKDQDEF